jgi:hypothetical protein
MVEWGRTGAMFKRRFPSDLRRTRRVAAIARGARSMSAPQKERPRFTQVMAGTGEAAIGFVDAVVGIESVRGHSASGLNFRVPRASPGATGLTGHVLSCAIYDCRNSGTRDSLPNGVFRKQLGCHITTIRRLLAGLALILLVGGWSSAALMAFKAEQRLAPYTKEVELRSAEHDRNPTVESLGRSFTARDRRTSATRERDQARQRPGSSAVSPVSPRWFSFGVRRPGAENATEKSS